MTTAADVHLSERDRREIDGLIASGGDQCVFSDRFVGDSHGRYIFEKEEVSKKLHVEAKGCALAGETCLALAKCLGRSGCSIGRLSLEWNSLGTSFDDGFAALTLSIGRNTSLVSLDLRNNHIGTEGGRVLAVNGMAHNTSIRTLDLRWNDIGTAGGLAFKDMLCARSSTGRSPLKDLHLCGNKIGQSLLDEIEAAMHGNEAMHKGNTYNMGSLQVMTDERHVITGTVEELKRELDKVHLELRTVKEQSRSKQVESESKQAELVSETNSRIESLEFDLQKSAKRVSVLEIQLMQEREKTEELRSANIGKDADLTSARDELAQVQRRLREEQEQSSAKVHVAESKMQGGVDRENKMLSLLRDHEKQISQATLSNNSVQAENSRLIIALQEAEERSKLAEGRAKQANTFLEQTVDECIAKVQKARTDAQEAIASAKNGLEARLKAAESRASEAERLEVATSVLLKSAESEALGFQVKIEESLSEQRKSLMNDFHRVKDAEVKELNVRLEEVESHRKLSEAQLSDMSMDLERQMGLLEKQATTSSETVFKLKQELSSALNEARKERQAANDFRIELDETKSSLDPLTERVNVCECERKEMEVARQRDIGELCTRLEAERDERQKEAAILRANIEEGNKKVAALREARDAEKRNHVKELHTYEKGIIAAIQAIFSDQRMKKIRDAKDREML